MTPPDPEEIAWAIETLDAGGVEAGPAGPPALPAPLAARTLPDGTVVTWGWERVFLGYSNRLQVWVDGTDPVMLEVPDGFATGTLEVDASARLLVVELPFEDKQDQVAVFDHRSGRMLTTFTGPDSVIRVRFSNGLLGLLGSRKGLQVRTEAGELLWSATLPTPVQAAPQVARSGAFALVADTVVFRDGRTATVGGGLRVVGDELVRTRADGFTLAAPVDAWIAVGASGAPKGTWKPPAPAPRPRPAPRWPEAGTQTVHVDSPLPVALFVKEDSVYWLRDEVAPLVQGLISSGLRFQEVRTVPPGGADWELDAAREYVLAAGTSDEPVEAFPGRTSRDLSRGVPKDTLEIRVRTADGKPAAGARIYRPDGYLLRVTDGEGRTVISKDFPEVVAFHGGRRSPVAAPGDLVLSEAAPRCRVLGFKGETWAPEADCEALSGMPSAEAFDLQEVGGVWEIRAVPQLLLRGANGLTAVVDQSAIVDATGTCHAALDYGISGVPAGPGTWWARVGDQWWRSELVMGEGDTVVIPAAKRVVAPTGTWVASCGLREE